MEIKSLPHDHGNRSQSLLADMPNSFDIVSDLFKMMSDNKRIQIFWLLCHCEECVINISALVDMSSPAVSHHLKLLKTAGLVVSRREGKEVYYTAANTIRAQALHEMVEQLIETACPAEVTFVNSEKYDSNIRTINQIHAFLTENLKVRYSIEELSVKFHINQTTLKTTFKTVFGQPVAAYMKAYRVKQASMLLAESEKTISQIASEVGYENQSKFTQAFKTVTGVLPKEYRKQSQS